MFLCWTPDGKRLTFAYSMAGVPSIFWTAADGSGPAEPESLVTSGWLPQLLVSGWSSLFFVEENPVSGSDIWIYMRSAERRQC